MGSNSFPKSGRLADLAQYLSLYSPFPSLPLQNTYNLNKDSNDLNAESGTVASHQLQKFKRKRAAVLICLFEDQEGNLRVILTQRSSTLSTHSGEVALPGGKVEEGDADDIQTALREAKEEIGLDPSIVDVVTVLDPLLTKYGVTVVPVIGIMYDKKAFNPIQNAAEVEAIFDAPLEMFLKDENRRARESEWDGEKHLLHFFDFEAENNKKYVIWALTAGILIKAASIVYQRPPDFVEMRPKYWGGNHHQSRF